MAGIAGANSMIILGLDASSTCIGYAVLVDGIVTKYGHYDLPAKADIAKRCELARAWAVGALATFQPALVKIESPVGRFAKAVIPQSRVSGAILSALSQGQALYVEVAPTEAKRALAKNGAASKFAMLAAAGLRLGLNGHERTVRGKKCLCDSNGTPILTEDEADAIGVALVARAVRVEKALC
jgi:Holliday junction resolvasome RuvABC endonuclease subunit